MLGFKPSKELFLKISLVGATFILALFLYLWGVEGVLFFSRTLLSFSSLFLEASASNSMAALVFLQAFLATILLVLGTLFVLNLFIFFAFFYFLFLLLSTGKGVFLWPNFWVFISFFLPLLWIAWSSLGWSLAIWERILRLKRPDLGRGISWLRALIIWGALVALSSVFIVWGIQRFIFFLARLF